VYSNVMQRVTNQDFDLIYTYNSRFLNEKAVEEVAKYLQKKVNFLDRFVLNWPDKYWIFESNIHDIEYRAKVVEKFYSSHPRTNVDQELELIAKDWFEKRELGITQHYTKNLHKKYKQITDSRKLITFFTSSEDELIYNNLESKAWPNQFMAIKKIIDIISPSSDFKLVIRIHPNTRTKSDFYKSSWEHFILEIGDNPNVNVIHFKDDLDSYDLLRQSDLVITAGSTVGVEAVIIGRKSVLLGEGLHSQMGICESPKNVEELKRIILSKDYILNPKNYYAALKYIYFLSLGGFKFENAKIRNHQPVNQQDPELFFFNKLVLKRNKITKLINKFSTKR
jgi:hypothetical protein